MLEANGGIVEEVGERIAKAARAFGSLKGPVFSNSNLSYKTKRMVYKAVVLGVLLYGSETWTTKHNMTRRLEAFHNHCLRGIVGITSAQQRIEHISSVQVASKFGMEESLEDLIVERRLRWLGHVARMEDHRLPKKVLFGWLPQQRPAHGTKMRLHDHVRKDLKKFGIEESGWYCLAQDRRDWRIGCRMGLEPVTDARLERDEVRRRACVDGSTGGNASVTSAKPYQCNSCERSFRQPQDIARHKCVTTHPKH